MRTVGVKWSRNLLATQQRVTMALTCGHFVSLTERELLRDSQLAGRAEAVLTGAVVEWDCAACPDKTVIEIANERTPQQMWKDAGEP